jgi:hypothetical protein
VLTFESLRRKLIGVNLLVETLSGVRPKPSVYSATIGRGRLGSSDRSITFRRWQAGFGSAGVVPRGRQY